MREARKSDHAVVNLRNHLGTSPNRNNSSNLSSGSGGDYTEPLPTSRTHHQQQQQQELNTLPKTDRYSPKKTVDEISPKKEIKTTPPKNASGSPAVVLSTHFTLNTPNSINLTPASPTNSENTTIPLNTTTPSQAGINVPPIVLMTPQVSGNKTKPNSDDNPRVKIGTMAISVAKRSALFVAVLLLGWFFAAVASIWELSTGELTPEW